MRVDGNGAKRTKLKPVEATDEPGDAINKRYKHGARRMLVVAEKLFGEHGINGVSLRQILAASSHGNKSAVYHHFGSKEGLIRAAFDMRMPALDKLRRNRLREAEKRGPVGIKELLEALLLPFIEMSPPSAGRACALFQLQLDAVYKASPDHPRERWRGHSSAAEEIEGRLRAELASLPDDIFDARLLSVVRLVLPGVAEIDPGSVSRFELTEGSIEKDLMNMAIAALSAPWP